VPADDTILIRSLNKKAGTIKKVSLLGHEKEVEWTQSEAGLEVNLTGIKTNKNGFVVEATF